MNSCDRRTPKFWRYLNAVVWIIAIFFFLLVVWFISFMP